MRFLFLSYSFFSFILDIIIGMVVATTKAINSIIPIPLLAANPVGVFGVITPVT